MKIAILLSGTGSTYAAISDAIDGGHIPSAKVVRVVSSKASALGLELAHTKGHPALLVNTKEESHHKLIAEQLRRDEVDLVVMAGYMHLWKLPADFEDKVINVHPSLIPAFCGQGMYGMHVHRAVIEKGTKISGCTVHLVDGKYDHGRILEQRSVSVESTDTPDSLAAKVTATEKSLLIHVIAHWEAYRP